MLISYLSANKIELPFQNIEEMLENTNYKIILNYNSAGEDFFKLNKKESFAKAYEERILPYKHLYIDLKGTSDFIKQIKMEDNLAYYDNVFAIE